MIRVIEIAALIALCFIPSGCEPKSDNNFPNNLKIKDLAPKIDANSPDVNKLKTINLDVHILDIPEENFKKLNEIRSTLNIKPIKFYNSLAFSANSFSAYYGKNKTLNTVYDLLKIAGAQSVTHIANILPDGESSDIMIKQLPQMQLVYYNSLDGLKEAARVGPGIIAMRITVEKTTSLDNAAAVTIYPIFTSMSSNAIPKLRMQEKLYDFPFTSAALRLNMIPGDLIFLAPESNISDQSTLGGLFFSNPDGTMFMNFNENKLPESKPSVRVYLLTCLGLNF
jgi:hypothetical protein